MIPSFAHYIDELSSGLRLVTVELPHLHTATLVMYAKVGSRYEDAHNNGLSHFLEHMLFRGTERLPDAYQLNYAIEALGGTLYAETGRDYSLYQLSLHPDTVAAGINLIGEIFCTPAFSGIEIERRIIMEEILEDFDEDGHDININDVARQAAFPRHPLGYKITGPASNVARFTVDDVRRHFARGYGARNMLLAVAGAVRHEQVVEQAEHALGHLMPGKLVEGAPPPPSLDGPKFIYVPNVGSQTEMQMLFRALPENSPDFPAQIALARILDDGMSTRLHHRICDQLGLAYYVSGSIDTFYDTALFEVDANSAHSNVPALFIELLRILTDLRNEPPRREELAKAQRRYRWDLEASFDDADAMAGWWGGAELYLRPHTFAEKVARMEAVTPQDVQRVAAQIFSREHLTVAAVGQLDASLESQLRELVDNFR